MKKQVFKVLDYIDENGDDQSLDFECNTPHVLILGNNLDDIIGLEQIGINIRERNGKYKITDKITGLKIPVMTSVIKTDITQLKEKIREELKTVDHKYLVLVDLAYSDSSTKGLK